MTRYQTPKRNRPIPFDGRLACTICKEGHYPGDGPWQFDLIRPLETLAHVACADRKNDKGGAS